MLNLFTPNPKNPQEEVFDTLLQTPNIQIEKITSNGQTSSSWYEQEKDEWVLLIEGEGHLLFENNEELQLKKGEYIFIAKMKKHKVVYTASPTIWLVIYF